MCETHGHEAKSHRHAHKHNQNKKNEIENKLCYRRMYAAFKKPLAKGQTHKAKERERERERERAFSYTKLSV